jgi:hypothetical protein
VHLAPVGDVQGDGAGTADTWLGEGKVVNAGCGQRPPVRRHGVHQRLQIPPRGVVGRPVRCGEQFPAPDVLPRPQRLVDPADVRRVERRPHARRERSSLRRPPARPDREENGREGEAGQPGDRASVHSSPPPSGERCAEASRSRRAAGRTGSGPPEAAPSPASPSNAPTCQRTARRGHRDRSGGAP